MKHQERDQVIDQKTSKWDQRIWEHKKEKALFEFSNMPGRQSQRMTQNHHKTK